MPDNEQKTVNNNYYGKVFQGPVTNHPTTPPPVTPVVPPTPPPPVNYTPLIIIGGLVFIVLIGFIGFLFFQENRKPENLVELPDGSGFYDYSTHQVVKVDRYEVDANLKVDTAKIYSQERIALGKVCKEKSGSTRSRTIYKTPIYNSYTFEQHQSQEQQQDIQQKTETKTEPPPVIREDPKPVKEKKSCKEKVREQRDDNDGNNKDINQ